MNLESFRSGLAPYIRGTTMKNLSLQAAAEAVHVPVPGLEEQRRIAAVLDQADELRAKRRAAIALLDTLTESIFLDMFGDLAGTGWERAPIAEVALRRPRSIRTGPFGSDLLHSEFVDDGIAVLGIDNAVQDRFAWGRPRFITAEKYDTLKQFTVHPGDVIVTIMGTCGRSAIVPDDIPVAINTKHLCCITLDHEVCLPTYLWAAFRFDRTLRRQLGAVAKGAVMPGLNKTLIESATITVPPIALQREFDSLHHQVTLAARAQDTGVVELNDLFASLQQRAFRGEL
jgi:type I restriction enzyme S subunit